MARSQVPSGPAPPPRSPRMASWKLSGLFLKSSDVQGFA